MTMHDDRWELEIAENGDVRLRDLKTGETRRFGGRRALFDALGVLADWREIAAMGGQTAPEDATVMVMVSPELVAQLSEWSPPVQVKVDRVPSSPTGYEMISRDPLRELEHDGDHAARPFCSCMGDHAQAVPGGQLDPNCLVHGDGQEHG